MVGGGRKGKDDRKQNTLTPLIRTNHFRQYILILYRDPVPLGRYVCVQTTP